MLSKRQAVSVICLLELAPIRGAVKVARCEDRFSNVSSRDAGGASVH